KKKSNLRIVSCSAVVAVVVARRSVAVAVRIVAVVRWIVVAGRRIAVTGRPIVIARVGRVGTTGNCPGKRRYRDSASNISHGGLLQSAHARIAVPTINRDR